MRHHEVRHHVADARIEQCDRAGHAHDAARFGLCQRYGLIGHVGLDQHRLAMGIVGLAGFGDCEAACRTLDQARAQTLFEQGNAAAEFGFGDSQCPAGRGKTAVIHDLYVVVEIIQIAHGSSFME